MRYAEIKDGVCVNTVEADEAFARFMNLVELPDGFGIGDYYTGGVWRSNADISHMEKSKESEISEACHSAIVAGVDVDLSDGSTGHFALEETDQINLTTAYNAVQTGAAGYPYHADGQLCRLYPAADIVSIGTAATKHKLYHTTYCNHLLMWARRSETADELVAITYGADLPSDLAENMDAVFGNAGS